MMPVLRSRIKTRSACCTRSFGIERKRDDDVGIEIAVVDETAAQDATALGRNGAIQILAVGHAPPSSKHMVLVNALLRP